MKKGFKKGDKVRRINCDWDMVFEGVYVGEIYTVIKCWDFNGSGDRFSIELKERKNSYEGYNFEFVENFQELLKKAKEIRRLGEKLL